MSKQLSQKQFKANLVELLDSFIMAVERANAAQRKLNPLEDPILYTFENFMKFLLHERNEKMKQDAIASVQSPSRGRRPSRQKGGSSPSTPKK